jgi:hypothetical protein
MKGFFRNFTGAIYDFQTKDFKSKRVVTDITRSIVFKDVGNIVRYDKYYITDGETPDNLAYKLYDDPTKHWLIYLLNPELQNGWPCSDQEIEKLIENKYGSYSFLSLANEDVYNIDFTIATQVSLHLQQNDPELDITFYQFDYTRRAFIISQKENDPEWMKNLETIYIKLWDSNQQILKSYQLNVNPDNCYYLMKNAAYSYNYKSYRDALIDGDSAQKAISFEQYEIDKNESKKFIRVTNRIEAERVSQQYFQILKDG